MAILGLEDIINVGFHKSNIGGYKAEEVDQFIDSVQETFEMKKAETDDLKKKLAILAKRVEQYRIEEESIKSTLLNAQKLADASVREAKHKAEVIIRDAQEKAHDVVGGIEDSYNEKSAELKNMQVQVTSFRAMLLDQYREHLRLIDALPKEEDFKGDQTENNEATVQELEVKIDTKAKIDQSQEINISSFDEVVQEQDTDTQEFDVKDDQNDSAQNKEEMTSADKLF